MVAVAVLGAIPAYWIVQTWLARVMLLPHAVALSSLLSVLFWTCTLASASLLVAAILVLRLAQCIRSAGRYPPPGMPVIRDTPVLRGDAACRRARGIKIAGWALVLSAMALFAASWHAHTVLSEPGEPKAVGAAPAPAIRG